MYALTRGVLASAKRSKNGLNLLMTAAAARSSQPTPSSQPAWAPTTSATRAKTQVPLQVNRAFSSSPLRWAANPQAGKPTSENVTHMVKNIKEEAGQVAASITSSIAGQPGSGDEKRSGGISGTSELLSDARGITGEMTKLVPRPALIWGAAGVLPYLSTAIASLYLARQTWLVSNGIDTHLDLDTAQALLLHAQNVQITFGAILLSFLGAIHWGLEFGKYGGVVGNRRYVLGLVPLALGWPTLLLTPHLALVSQWAAYVVAWFIDLKASDQGWVPKWYSTYRFWLTTAVGGSIIVTLIGTRYYSVDGADSGQRSVAHNLAVSKLDQIEHGGKVEKGGVQGDIDAKPADEEADGYVKVTNIRKQKEEEEERKRQEAEKQKQKDKKSAQQEEKLSEQKEKEDEKKA
ncbi:hypothetical protein V8E36_007634 [Tilletia maclaganii]